MKPRYLKSCPDPEFPQKKAGRAARLPNVRRLLLAIRLLLLLIRHPLLEGIFLQSVLAVVDFLGMRNLLLLCGANFIVGTLLTVFADRIAPGAT